MLNAWTAYLVVAALLNGHRAADTDGRAAVRDAPREVVPARLSRATALWSAVTRATAGIELHPAEPGRVQEQKQIGILLGCWIQQCLSRRERGEGEVAAHGAGLVLASQSALVALAVAGNVLRVVLLELLDLLLSANGKAASQASARTVMIAEAILL